MDCAHLLHLGFLLLAVAAPRPNIAISRDNLGEDSYFGKTRVAIYHCKDCKSSTCQSEPLSFENFEKIAETQNKIFSNGAIELVTNKTHVTVCFAQANSFLEGIYGIIWEKSGGIGLSCGVLNSGVFSENEKGYISTEERKICCEAETNLWQPNPTLKWFNKPSGPKASTPPIGIPDNPEPPTSEKDTVVIFFAVTFLLILMIMATMFCYFRHGRGQAFRKGRRTPKEEHFTHA